MIAKMGNITKAIGEGICIIGACLFILFAFAIIMFDRVVPILIDEGVVGWQIISAVVLTLAGITWLMFKLLYFIKANSEE